MMHSSAKIEILKHAKVSRSEPQLKDNSQMPMTYDMTVFFFGKYMT